MKKPQRGKAAPRKSSPPRSPSAPPVEVTVERFAWGGRAVGKILGKVYFISRAVPGDKLLVRPTREHTSFAEAETVAVLRPSPDRVEPRCKFFSHCGGCQWLSTAYHRQAAEKDDLVSQALRHHLDGVERLPIVPAEPFLGYRHRGEFHARPEGEGARLGFFQEGSHKLVNLDTCLLFSPEYNRRYSELRSLLRSEPAAAALKSVTLDCSEDESRFALHFAMQGEEREPAGRLVALAQRLGFDGVLATPAHSPQEVLAATGEPVTYFRLPAAATGLDRNFTLQADVRSFTQAHYPLSARLVGAALAWLAPQPEERLLDLYSGGGNFSLPLAARSREVVAVEGSPSACDDAEANAKANGITNLVHIRGDVRDETRRFAQGGERFGAVLLDPPRAGVAELLPDLAALNPERILYVSCNLPVLERDLDGLAGFGYRPYRVQGWDLFPQTYGVETVVLLGKAL